MRRHGLSILAACATLFSFVCLSVHSGQKAKTTDEQREEFVKNFKRLSLNTTFGDAMLLRILVGSTNAKRGIEVGSANGFGAINMGIAFERTGGHLYTLEISPRMARECRENIKKIGLEKTITCIEGDALKTLPKMEGEFDFLFLDARKSDYLKYYKAVEAKLKPGAMIVADNAIRSAGAMKDFLDYMKNSPDFDMVIVRASMEKRDGLAVCYKIR